MDAWLGDEMSREEKPAQREQRENWLGGEALVRRPPGRRWGNLTSSQIACVTVAVAFGFGAGLILGSAATMLLRRK